MRILIVEDEDDKFSKLEGAVRELHQGGTLELERASYFSHAQKLLYSEQYDIVILDLMLPLREDDPTAIDVSEEIIETVQASKYCEFATILALSSFSDVVDTQLKRFSDAGILLAGFDDGEKVPTWLAKVARAFNAARNRSAFDFVIVCALEKERQAYARTDAVLGDYRSIAGLDCLELNIGDRSGVCVALPRMGLVNASLVTARVVEKFNPKLVAMSGICAGVAGKADIGTIVVADMCWEYQAGKWSGNGFKIEHFDCSIDPQVRTSLAQMIAVDDKMIDMKLGLIEDKIVFEKVIMQPMATGSAVIADSGRMDQIAEQHRQMAALDMEMYGVYKAAELGNPRPLFFGAKTVVDVGDQRKSDTYQEYGSIVSARFVVKSIARLLG
ncbi:MAG: hypothetical protein KJ944_21345 [Alphaproteobacteria bacterium]|nr:hypothetical protein [Alphaproteobacteria bacterium]MBU1559758.1 hypothetical protein [Alphaproteobacteria bacterium]MBU2305137.1 hypothetical protein [Alphaproteobacteria bacterium]MBU2367942.1 hypothetical protein [Alphaproteobacteria bacterium]